MKLPDQALRCLLVEDSADDAMLLLRQLREDGFVVTSERVDTPTALRAALENSPWDVVVSDFSMPQFSGLDALKILQASGRDLPFILVSGAMGEETAVAAMKAGAHDYLLKGDLTRLPAAIKRELASAADRLKQQKAQEMLKETEWLLKETGRIGHVGGWEFNIDTHQQIWTEEVYLIHEVDCSFKPTVEAGINFYSPESRPLIAQAVQRAIEYGEPFDLELEIVTARGNRKTVLARGRADKERRKIHGFFQDITKRKQDEAVDAFLAQTMGQNFFQDLASFLARTLRMDYICIDRLEGDALTATTLAVWHDGHFEDNVSYVLKDTPCGAVVEHRVCCYPDRVTKLFPHDAALRDLQAKSYVGITLRSHTGKPIGLIAVIGRHPLTDRALAEATLTRVVPRAAGELERMQAEASLRANELKFREMINNLQVGVVAHGPDTKVLVSNPRASEILGLSQDQMLGKVAIDPAWCFLREDGTKLPLAEYPVNQGLARNLPVNDIIAGIVRPDRSTPLWVTCNARRIVGPDGKLEQIIVAFTDITERRRAEAALRESEDRFRRSVVDAPFPIMIHAENGEVIQLSNAFCEISGYHREELTTVADWTERAYGDHKGLVQVAIDKAFRLETRKYEGDFPIRSKSGEIRIWEFSSAPLGHLPDGRRLVISMAVDVTERRAGERDLARAKQLLESTGALSKTGGWEVDLTTMKLTWTRETFRIAGIDGTVKPPLEDGINLFAPAARPVIAAAVQAAIDSGTPYNLELPWIDRNGRALWVITQGYAEMKDGKSVRLYGTIQDITEQKQAEERLEQLAADLTQQNETLSRFNTAMVGREMRMVELKQEINELCRRLGEEPPYQIAAHQSDSLAVHASGSKSGPAGILQA